MQMSTVRSRPVRVRRWACWPRRNLVAAGLRTTVGTGRRRRRRSWPRLGRHQRRTPGPAVGGLTGRPWPRWAGSRPSANSASRAWPCLSADSRGTGVVHLQAARRPGGGTPYPAMPPLDDADRYHDGRQYRFDLTGPDQVAGIGEVKSVVGMDHDDARFDLLQPLESLASREPGPRPVPIPPPPKACAHSMPSPTMTATTSTTAVRCLRNFTVTVPDARHRNGGLRPRSTASRVRRGWARESASPSLWCRASAARRSWPV